MPYEPGMASTMTREPEASWTLLRLALRQSGSMSLNRGVIGMMDYLSFYECEQLRLLQSSLLKHYPCHTSPFSIAGRTPRQRDSTLGR